VIARALVCLIAFAPSIAIAQQSAQGTEAPVRIATGFTPDPMRLTGRARGVSPMAARAGSCRGFTGEAPDHRVELTTRFGFLRLFVVAPNENVTLAVRGPSGQWRCSGRLLDGAPREEGAFEPGVYELWVGSRTEDVEVPYDLFVTEFQSVTPTTGRTDDRPVSGGADIGLDIRAARGRHGDNTLRRGFLPDPRYTAGEAGGPIDAALLGGACRGRVDPQPSHVLTLREPFDYFRVELADAPGRATLIIRAPDGNYFCSSPDDANAFVDSTSWTPGRYLVWVGSRSGEPPYRMMYSEVRPAAD
jgi:hypothetical protein